MRIEHFAGPWHRRLFLLLFAGLAVAAMTAAGAADAAADGMSRAEAYRRAEALTALGRTMFADPALSASGKMSCASCHSPRHSFGPPNGHAVQLGGEDMLQPGRRAVPSLRYLQSVPQFTEHFHDSEDDGDESVDNGPTGGLTWDGRVDRGSDQARVPLLSPFEMANHSAAEVVARVRARPYAGDIRRLFGDAVFRDPAEAFDAILKAFEVYEQSASEFYPYSSKFDAYLAGKVTLAPRERRGLALFEDPAKGNCARCHISTRGNDGTPPQFTDNGFIALGLPRNDAIPANADPAFYDLGLCGPDRTDLRDRAEYCGRFTTPTLRNVATRRTFFHNGVAHSLTDAVRFYVERDTRPEKWYPRNADGSVRKFNDLPARYQANIEREPPFGQRPGDKPVLSESEIQDIVAFLQTLTDGYGAKP